MARLVGDILPEGMRALLEGGELPARMGWASLRDRQAAVDGLRGEG